MIQKRKELETNKSLTTNFLSWICQPLSKRIQRSVPSGFSYSQKPNAEKITNNWWNENKPEDFCLPWSLPFAPCTRFQLTTLPQF